MWNFQMRNWVSWVFVRVRYWEKQNKTENKMPPRPPLHHDMIKECERKKRKKVDCERSQLRWQHPGGWKELLVWKNVYTWVNTRSVWQTFTDKCVSHLSEHEVCVANLYWQMCFTLEWTRGLCGKPLLTNMFYIWVNMRSVGQTFTGKYVLHLSERSMGKLLIWPFQVC